MKTRTLLAAVATMAFAAFSAADVEAQVVKIWKNGEVLYSAEASEVDSISFHELKTEPLTELGRTFVAVDLGLSVKWASFNLGATAPEEYGVYYQWGDPVAKTDATCNWANYKWSNGTSKTLTKYNSAESYGADGFTDGKTVLDKEDDAAAVALGGTWRMPTDKEIAELQSNCRWDWTAINEVYGYKVTSTVDGYTDKWIFLPASGYRGSDGFNGCGSDGYYWSTFRDRRPYNAMCIHFSSDVVETLNNLRAQGYAVRPVSE